MPKSAAIQAGVMPIYLDIDRLDHVVMIVAQGDISDAEVRKAAQDLLAADVAPYAKIIDNSAASMHETPEQIDAIVRMMREGPGHDVRGPVACVVDARNPGDALTFAEQSAADRPIRLFTSLREARRWAAEMMAERR
jgi:hypothetical protein